MYSRKHLGIAKKIQVNQSSLSLKDRFTSSERWSSFFTITLLFDHLRCPPHFFFVAIDLTEVFFALTDLAKAFFLETVNFAEAFFFDAFLGEVLARVAVTFFVGSDLATVFFFAVAKIFIGPDLEISPALAPAIPPSTAPTAAPTGPTSAPAAAPAAAPDTQS